MEAPLPPSWPRPRGYADSVFARGRVVLMAGMIGWNAQDMSRTDDLIGQVHQALQNIVEVLAAGSAKSKHIVCMAWYMTNKKACVVACPEIGKAFRELVGSFSIMMTAVGVGALVEDRVKVEIEVTTVVPGQGDPQVDGTQGRPCLYKNVRDNRGGPKTANVSPLN